jgi:hypothetical protein
MRKKYVTLLVALVFCGCATQKMIMVNTAGMTIPTPHYSLNPIGTKMVVTFYYVGEKDSKDLDGTEVSSNRYYSMGKMNDIWSSKINKLYMIVLVSNPEKLTYSFYDQKEIKRGTSYHHTDMRIGEEVGMSNHTFRRFVYRLPFSGDVWQVSQSLVMSVGGQPAAIIGPFMYRRLH